MSIDGANMGATPEDSLKLALSGDQPQQEMTKEQVLEKVLSMPDDYSQVHSYGDGCYWLAKRFYELRKSGVEGDPHFMYDAMRKRCGEQDYDFTGFMVGWANNCSRWLLALDEVENPAIIVIGR